MSQFFEVNPAARPAQGPRAGPWRRQLPRSWQAALGLPEEVRGAREARVPAGTYRLGPDDGTLSLRTRRTGAAAKAGHDLLIHVTAWDATLEVGEDPAAIAIALDADGGSLRVLEGTGGAQALGDDDKANIQQTIDDEILKRGQVTFRSTDAQPAPNGLVVRGDLTLEGATQPIAVDLDLSDGARLVATAVVTQTGWGMKPYSILFGALKVVDEVDVRLEAALPQSR